MIEIQNASAAMAGLVSELQKETFRQAYSDRHRPEDIDAYCNRNYSRNRTFADLCSSQTVCTLALRANVPVGYTLMKHHDCPVPLEGPSSELKQIYVLSTEYGTGAGRALYCNALDKARRSGRSFVWLCVADTNTRAQSFYKKQGFDTVGTGPVLEVGADRLTSKLLALRVS